MPGRTRTPPDLRELAAEVIRRASPPHGDEDEPVSPVILLSDPSTAAERLQLLGAWLRGVPVMVMDRECMTDEEWIKQYCVTEPDR